MSVNVGHLFRKRTVRDLNGNIIDMSDDTKGGAIVSKGNVVNQVAMDELIAKENDKKPAAVAFTVNHDAPEEVREQRTNAPGKVEKLEAELAEMKEMMAELLKKK